MSRSYDMRIVVTGVNNWCCDAVIAALKHEWFDLSTDNEFDIEHESLQHSNIDVEGDGYLCGGETEEEFAHRIAIAVWKANKGPCGIRVYTYYTDDPPCEIYAFDTDRYEEFKNKGYLEENTADESQ